MKKTFLELEEVDKVVGTLFLADPTLEKSKFGWAFSRFVQKNYAPMLKERNERLTDLWVEWAMVDPVTKAVVQNSKNSRGFDFDKPSLKNVIEKEREIFKEFQAREIEVKPHISSFVPELDEEQRELLTGLLI